MATAAQIEANRRNSQKSCGLRTRAGKDKSRFNALDHGCRANILVLPTEEFGDYENQCDAWKLSFKPHNPAEEVLIEGIVSLGDPRGKAEVRALFANARVRQAGTEGCGGGAADAAGDRRSSHP